MKKIKNTVVFCLYENASGSTTPNVDYIKKLLPNSYLTFEDEETCSRNFFNFVEKVSSKSRGSKDLLLKFSVSELHCVNSACQLLEKVESVKEKKIKKIFVCLNDLQNYKKIQSLKNFADLWIDEIKIKKNKITLSAKAWGESLKLECKNPEKILEFLTFGES